MTEKEKDAFIVQLRGEVTMYRDAYNDVLGECIKDLIDG